MALLRTLRVGELGVWLRRFPRQQSLGHDVIEELASQIPAIHFREDARADPSQSLVSEPAKSQFLRGVVGDAKPNKSVEVNERGGVC